MASVIESNATVHPAALCESEHIGKGTRVWAYAHVMADAHIGENCNIGDHAFIESGARIGNGVVIKNNVMIWDGVTLEDNVFVGPGVTFTNDRFPRSRHKPEAQERYADSANWLEQTRVCSGASLGARTIVVSRTVIGAHAMTAAGSLVTHDVPPHRLVAGQPAREIGWVCSCGQRLDDSLTCPQCRRRYERSENTITVSMNS
jgi:acetyltransferase-like isoleucine patch superfamily enzyme